MIIIGAGLAGCMAALLIPGSKIYELGPEKKTHQALLRFRSSQIGDALGIQFKEVKVYKGIWHNDQSVPLTPRAIALYSRKVSDTISYRSITNLDTVTRYIAPDDFHDMLKQQLNGRLRYNISPNAVIDGPAISTLPIFVNAKKFLGMDIETRTQHSSIYVTSFRVPDCDVYMTYYYTDPTTPVYRASITGNKLIIESTFPISIDDINTVKRSFGMSGLVLDKIEDNFEQKNGKIVPMDETTRREIVAQLTIKEGIYSLGRFATWRNLLMDDVYHDVSVIKRLMNQDVYSVLRENSK